jgi:PAS domain S-box-containing protein
LQRSPGWESTESGLNRLPRTPLVRYGIALTAALLALALRLLLTPLFLADGPPYITFVLATALSAGYGGLGPGLVTTLCSTLLVEYVVRPYTGQVPFVDPGNVVRFVVICVVISFVCRALIRTGERAKAAELAERQGRLFSQQTLAAIGDGVISTDGDGNVRFLNPLAQHLTGCTVADARGKPLKQVFVTDAGAAVARDGSRVPVEFHEQPIKDETGKTVGAVLVIHDITKRLADEEQKRRNEASVREANRVYQAVGEFIPFGVWICDVAGRNTYASDSFLQLLGITQAQCSEFGWSEVLHPDDREVTTAAWKECVRTGGAWDREHRFRGVDGDYHPVLARGVPVRDDDGKLLCWAGINLDIRRMKETEAALQSQASELARSNRELEQFAYVASHDLQEPLRMVNAYTQLLLRDPDTKLSERSEEFAAYVRQGVERMVRLIEDLLAFSRVVHGDAQRVPVDAGAALEHAMSSCRQILTDSEGQVESEKLPCVLAQEGPLTLVYQNLISNALKYRRPDIAPRIQISCTREPAGAVFCVQDNGMGFDPAYAQTIFGLFKRLHGKEYPGTGLGLAICQRIVERYGGQMWADSKPGVGSTFYFRLPLA